MKHDVTLYSLSVKFSFYFRFMISIEETNINTRNDETEVEGRLENSN